MRPHEIDMIVSQVGEPRSAALIRSVLERLPDDWDYYRTFDFEISDAKPHKGYASALREEEGEGDPEPGATEGHHEQCWTVTLYRPWLAAFSDEAAQWLIAHELGHVAAGMACGSIVIGGRTYTRTSALTDDGEEFSREITSEEQHAREKVADAIARAWGFWLEEEAFERERPD